MKLRRRRRRHCHAHVYFLGFQYFILPKLVVCWWNSVRWHVVNRTNENNFLCSLSWLFIFYIFFFCKYIQTQRKHENGKIYLWSSSSFSSSHFIFWMDPTWLICFFFSSLYCLLGFTRLFVFYTLFITFVSCVCINSVLLLWVFFVAWQNRLSYKWMYGIHIAWVIFIKWQMS